MRFTLIVIAALIAVSGVQAFAQDEAKQPTSQAEGGDDLRSKVQNPVSPRSISVSRSEWRRREGRLELFVELRDVNYPGSTYTLVYQSENDRLYGIYYQAVLGQVFEVEFVRVK